MSFLTIAGTAYRVQATGSASENQPEQGGGLRRSWNGTPRNNTRWEKRSWSFVLTTTNAEYDALYAAVKLNAKVALGGVALPSGVTFGRVQITGARYTDQTTAGAPDTIREVAITIVEE